MIIITKGKVPSDFNSELPVFVNNCGYQKNCEYDVYTRREKGRNDYHIIFVRHGEMLAYDKKATSGEVIVYLPHQKQEYTYLAGEKNCFYWVHFSGTDIDSLLKELSLTSGIIDCSGRMGEIEEIFRMICASYEEHYTYSESYAAGLLRALLALIASPADTRSPFSRAIKAIEDLSVTLSVKKLSEAFGMSEGHFIRSFKASTGMTPLSYRLKLQIEQAKTLLVGTDLQINSIAGVCGFSDSFYFSRIFKKHTGKSPTEYRTGF